MSLVRYNPREFRPISFNSFIDRFFNDDLDSSARGGSRFVPQVDVIENDKSFEIHVAVPGVSKKDFSLEVNENRLIISGERKFESKKGEKNYRSVETYFGSFQRSFQLPEHVDSGKVEAKYENGILFVSIPKDENKVLKRTIDVK